MNETINRIKIARHSGRRQSKVRITYWRCTELILTFNVQSVTFMTSYEAGKPLRISLQILSNLVQTIASPFGVFSLSRSG